MIIRPVKNPEHFRSTIINYINEHVNNDKYSRNIEKGIYNYTIQTCNSRKIVKKWENTNFVLIYVNKFKIIFHNIKNPVIISKVKKKKIFAS
jgi:hypothetical protein